MTRWDVIYLWQADGYISLGEDDMKYKNSPYMTSHTGYAPYMRIWFCDK